MVVLLIHPASDAQGYADIRQHQEMELRRRYNGIYDYFPEIADEKIYGVEKKKILHRLRIAVNGIENGRHVHQELGEYAPKVLDITEEHVKRREDKAHAQIEKHQHADRVEQHDEFPCKRDSVKDAEHEEHAKGQPEIDEALDILGEEEQVLRHVYLGENAGVPHKGAHALGRGLVEEREHKVAAEQIDGVMRRVSAEELGKHQTHDQQHQQRRQDAPRHAQHRAFIFLFEVTFHQFLEEEAVLSEFFDHISVSVFPVVKFENLFIYTAAVVSIVKGKKAVNAFSVFVL